MSEVTSWLSRARFIVDDIDTCGFDVYKCVISLVVHERQVAQLAYRQTSL